MRKKNEFYKFTRNFKKHQKKQRPAFLITCAVFSFWVLTWVWFTMIFENESLMRQYNEILSQRTINQLTLDNQKQNYYSFVSNQIYYDTEEPVMNLKYSEQDYLKAKFPKSPLINLVPVFYQKGYEKGFTDEQIRLLISITGTESGFGTQAWYNNFYGILCTRSGKTSTDCGWTTPEYGISRAYDLVGNYLKKWNGTKEDLQSVFVGNGKYCASECLTWSDSTYHFYQKFNG